MKTQNVPKKKLVQYVLLSAGNSDIEKSDDHLMIIWESHDTPWSSASSNFGPGNTPTTCRTEKAEDDTLSSPQGTWMARPYPNK